MTARDVESALLARCSAVAREATQTAQDQKEANVFQLAAIVVQSQFPTESKYLMQASDRYFASHPNERLSSAEVVRRGWVMSLPRLRDMLSRNCIGAEVMPASPLFHTQTALAEGLRELFRQLEERLSLRSPVNVYLAGGMAVHLYTQIVSQRMLMRSWCPRIYSQ